MTREPLLRSSEVIDGGDLCGVKGRDPQGARECPPRDVLGDGIEGRERIPGVEPGPPPRHPDEFVGREGDLVNDREIGVQRGVEDQSAVDIDAVVAAGDVDRAQAAAPEEDGRPRLTVAAVTPLRPAEREIAAGQAPLAVELEFLGPQDGCLRERPGARCRLAKQL